MNASITTTPPEVWSYNSIEEIPDEFKESRKVEELPNNSYGLVQEQGYLIVFLQT